MKKLIEDFSRHLSEAIQIGNNANLNKTDRKFSNILICGLGGSGIGGSIVTQVLAQTLKVPAVVNKDYDIPSFINENTLVIMCSYSGNTEETIIMLDKMEGSGAEIACITSGGKLVDTAKERNYNLIQIPDGMPPRAAFGYSFPQLFYVLTHYDLIDNSFEKGLKNSITLLDTNEESIKTEAKKLAENLLGKIPIIYSDAWYEGVAVRFRQQINENSKMLCWHHSIPEMNHNELVGWRLKSDDFAVVIFRNEDDYYRTQKRMDINKEIISQYTKSIFEIHSKGANRLEKSLYLIHLGDWVSVYLAELKQIDPVEVDVITTLKGSLSNI